MPRKPDISIVGCIYNSLRVDAITSERNSYGRLLYSCTCLKCGKKRLATKNNLKKGEIKDCGYHTGINLIGQRFGNLLVIGYSDNIKNKWRCQCDCGKMCDAATQDLQSGKKVSCGCMVAKRIKKLYIDGTAPCKLNGDNIRVTNTSGVTGVYWDKSRNMWSAEIMFKHKKYHLGRFAKKSDAIAARKNAEKNIWGDFIEWYKKYRAGEITLDELEDSEK